MIIFRRLTIEKSNGIGIWFEILSGLTRISVITNVSLLYKFSKKISEELILRHSLLHSLLILLKKLYFMLKMANLMVLLNQIWLNLSY